ncbi:MAG: hypothetical protein QHH10_14125 [Peptococcaceae bacterium]|nr:hypothetical protein [Peptococcaceae bacterium]MDH7526433.1 hypothetical protein [Peptococcaceae bacterium]
MGKPRARFRLELRTGFFKTETYTVELTEDALVFTRDTVGAGRDEFAVPCGEVRSIAVSGGSPAELEIRTAEEMYIGTWQENASREELETVIDTLKEVFGKRFICV